MIGHLGKSLAFYARPFSYVRHEDPCEAHGVLYDIVWGMRGYCMTSCGTV